jgi:hypothetical protein
MIYQGEMFYSCFPEASTIEELPLYKWIPIVAQAIYFMHWINSRLLASRLGLMLGSRSDIIEQVPSVTCGGWVIWAVFRHTVNSPKAFMGFRQCEHRLSYIQRKVVLRRRLTTNQMQRLKTAMMDSMSLLCQRKLKKREYEKLVALGSQRTTSSTVPRKADSKCYRWNYPETWWCPNLQGSR